MDCEHDVEQTEAHDGDGQRKVMVARDVSVQLQAGNDGNGRIEVECGLSLPERSGFR